jgi:hypothetical protein
MTAETWTARAKLPSFYVLQFEVYEGHRKITAPALEPARRSSVFPSI